MDIPKDELELEQSAAQAFNKDEARSSIINELGLDEVTDGDKLDKLVQKEEESHQKLSKAIGQKIKWRTEASKPPVTKVETKVIPPEDLDKTIGAIMSERLESRDLDEMPYPEELKAEIQRIAKITNKSVKLAAKDPYITAKIDVWKKENDVEEAAITRKNRTSGTNEVSLDNVPEFDFSTEEGRKAHDDWKAKLAKQLG